MMIIWHCPDCGESELAREGGSVNDVVARVHRTTCKNGHVHESPLGTSENAMLDDAVLGALDEAIAAVCPLCRDGVLFADGDGAGHLRPDKGAIIVADAVPGNAIITEVFGAEPCPALPVREMREAALAAFAARKAAEERREQEQVEAWRRGEAPPWPNGLASK
jgi:hypothetical protein